MATTTFTTRLDAGLKERLQKVAQLDQRSASFLANQAIANMVEEREATRELVEVGLMLADKGVSISDEAVQAWMEGPEDAPFPEAEPFSN